MIECEKCGIYFYSDEINECPECATELCESCYESHIRICLLGASNEDTEDDSEKLPAECPSCGNKLELDVDYDTSTLYCEECKFEMDVTEQLASNDDHLEDDDINI